MKIKFDYSKDLQSMTVELIAESNLDHDCVEIMWRDRFEISSLHRSEGKHSVTMSMRNKLNHQPIAE